MGIINLGRVYSVRNIIAERPPCPKCQGELVPTGHQVFYRSNPADTALEFWCETEQSLIIIWNETGLAQYFLKDLQASDTETQIYVNDEKAIFSPKIKDLFERGIIDPTSVCEGKPNYVTCNMRKTKFLGWVLEYWCENKGELFADGPWDPTLFE